MTNTVQKPLGLKYVNNPTTLGQKLLNRRLELGLFQKDVAVIIGVSEDSITYWENERAAPQVRYFPAIIKFLGYFPFQIDTTNLAGKIIQYRYIHGLSQEDLANKLEVNESTVFHYESDKHAPLPKILQKLEFLLSQ